MIDPPLRKLWDAISTLRLAGLNVRHVEGEGWSALWDVGPLTKIGMHEVIRLAEKVKPPSVAAHDKLNTK